MRQNALTVMVPIKPGEVEALKGILREIGDDIKDNPRVRFRDTPSTHFARWVVLEDEAGPRPRLLFSSNHDGALEGYARELAERVGPGMEEIWGKCEGYSPGTSRDPARFAEFIARHSIGEPQVFYVAYAGQSVSTVRQGLRLRELVDGLLDRHEIASWLTDRYARPPDGAPANPDAVSRVGGAGAHRSEPPLVLKALEWIVGVRSRGQPERRMVAGRNLTEVEDRVVQNQMTIVSPVKSPLFVRVPLLKLVLLLVNLQARQSRGSLSGLTTIHFARWVLIDGGRNLLFESNFDGSWERYIDDFVDRASVGMNLVWANCRDFPRAGARDIEAFKEIIRRYQHPSQVFYSAYPGATVVNVLDGLLVGDAVGRFLRQEEVQRFVSGAYHLGSPQALERLFAGGAAGSARPWGVAVRAARAVLSPLLRLLQWVFRASSAATGTVLRRAG